MTISETKFYKPSVLPKWLIPAIIAVGFLGFLDSTYLAVKYYQGSGINCVIFEGCDRVAASAYATIGNVPVALMGVFFYLTIIVLALAYWDTRKRAIITLVSIISVIGFIASVRFVYLQVFVIKAICTYCIGSAVTSSALLGLGLYAFKKNPIKDDSGPII